MIKRLQQHPCTPQDFLDLFPSEDAAGHALKRLWKNHKIKRVGVIQGEKGGRPRWLYCTRNVKTDWHHHEHELTKFFLKYPEAQVQRVGLNLPERPDGIMTLNGQTYYVEMDCGTEDVSYIYNKRFSRYAPFKGICLWLCPDEERREELRAAAEIVAHNSLFAVLNDAVTDPHGEIWIDYSGDRTALR